MSILFVIFIFNYFLCVVPSSFETCKIDCFLQSPVFDDECLVQIWICFLLQVVLGLHKEMNWLRVP